LAADQASRRKTVSEAISEIMTVISGGTSTEGSLAWEIPKVTAANARVALRGKIADKEPSVEPTTIFQSSEELEVSEIFARVDCELTTLEEWTQRLMHHYGL
jgi:hypothetical protein